MCVLHPVGVVVWCPSSVWDKPDACLWWHLMWRKSRGAKTASGGSGTQEVTNIFQILRLHKSHLLNWLFALEGTNLFREAGDGGVDQEEGHLAWENNSGIICIHPFLLPVHLFCRFAWDTEERLWRTAWEVRVVPGDIVKDGFCDESNLWPPFCWICNRQRSKIRMKSNINMRNLLLQAAPKKNYHTLTWMWPGYMIILTWPE